MTSAQFTRFAQILLLAAASAALAAPALAAGGSGAAPPPDAFERYVSAHPYGLDVTDIPPDAFDRYAANHAAAPPTDGRSSSAALAAPALAAGGSGAGGPRPSFRAIRSGPPLRPGRHGHTSRRIRPICRHPCRGTAHGRTLARHRGRSTQHPIPTTGEPRTGEHPHATWLRLERCRTRRRRDPHHARGGRRLHASPHPAPPTPTNTDNLDLQSCTEHGTRRPIMRRRPFPWPSSHVRSPHVTGIPGSGSQTCSRHRALVAGAG